MIHSLIRSGNISSAHQLLSMDGEVHDTPFLFFLKDLKGRYLDANQSKLHYFGFKNRSDIVGLTDFDLCMTEQQAIQIRENDKKIVITAKSKAFLETATVAANRTLQGISFKTPLRIKSNKIIGSFGVTFVLPEFTAQEGVPNHYIPMLSKKQNQCLNLLVQGLKIKEIAKQMHLSPRTIEHYLEAIKAKLNCSSRAELTKIFLQWKISY